MRRLKYVFFQLLVLAVALSFGTVGAEPIEEFKSSVRCSVCGMFVAKYPVWLSQIQHESGKVMYFDGVKDMLVYYFNPVKYGSDKTDSISEMWTKDYYTLKWLDARKAFFVQGSDVYGPMGHEFIPFSTREAAESFKKDHAGKSVISFEEITDQQVHSLRTGR